VDGDAMKLHPLISLTAMAAIALLYLPLLAVALFSVNDARYTFAWRGFTTRWYAQLFTDPRMAEIVWNTLVLATVSTLIATVLGTLLAVAMHRTPWTRRKLLAMEAAVQLPVVTPDIIFAVSLVVAFGLLRQVSSFFEPGLPTMILGHVTFQVAFVALVVRGRLATLGPTMEEAARDLYAEGWSLTRRVTLPLMWPGVVAGAMLAFTLSLDDFVISYFTAGPESMTLPIYIYASLRRGLPPQVHALSTLMILATVVLVLAIEQLTRYGSGKEG
jgi:spermidine/putrescine transport system permease protein